MYTELQIPRDIYIMKVGYVYGQPGICVLLTRDMYVIISGYVYTIHVALCANVKQSPLLGPI